MINPNQENLQPSSTGQALSLAMKSISDARKNLRAAFDAPDGWKRLSLKNVKTLQLHATESPDARSLADFLSEMIPGEFLSAEVQGGTANLTPQGASKSIAADLRMLKLRSAVIEAGLAEQCNANGTLRVGTAFSAQKLEASLDDWLRAGRHRGGEFDDAPLSQIDKLITKNCTQPDEGLHIRCGLLIPVVMVIHIWRYLESAPEHIADQVGWKLRSDSLAT